MDHTPGPRHGVSRRLLGLLLVAGAMLALSLPTALAQEDDGATAIFGTLRAGGEPVEGATVVVQRDGEEVGGASSNADGQWSVEVPEGGTYTVAIDQESLPEGFTIRDAEEQATKEVSVAEGGRQAVLFPIVEAEAGGVSGETLARVVTLFVSGIQLGAVIAITSIGLSLIFGVTGLVNFAHGEMVAFGAVAALYLNGPFRVPTPLVLLTALVLAVSLAAPLARSVTTVGGAGSFRGVTARRVGVTVLLTVAAGAVLFVALFWSEDVNIHIVAAGLIAIIGGGFLGYAMEGSVFGPLRRRNVGLIAMLVISIGLSILLRYGILIVYGGNSNPYRQYTIPSQVTIGPLATSSKELVVILLSLIVLVAVGLLLQRTKLGTAMRAVADNRDLAESSGIDVQRVIMATWVAGGALAAYGGVMQGVMQAVAWDMGFKFLLLMFAGVILGGLGTAFGAVVGGLIVGIVTQMSSLWVSVEMKYVFAFLVLIIVLLVRPQGVLGRKERIG